jgi:glycosyltransferase involved in cell wall biosynthesis
MRWLIAEDSLESRKGHWFEYLRSFIRELPKAGDEVQLLVSKRATKEIREYFSALALLPESAFNKMSDGAPVWRRYARIPIHASLTFFAVSRFLKRSAAFEIIFVPTVTLHHLLGWFWLIKTTLRRSPVTVLLFFPGLPIRRSLGRAELNGSPTASIFALLLRGLATEIRAGKVVLGVETEAMKVAAQEVFHLPFTYLPHPVQREGAVGHRRSSALTMACYGPARHEKGGDVLSIAIDQFLQTRPCKDIEFVLQWMDDFSLPDGDSARLPETLEHHPQVEVVRRLFNEDEYAHWLAQTDVLLLPYRKSSYDLRVSRVAIEAFVYGIPLIATRGTTLAAQAEEFGAVVLCEDGDIRSVTEAICEAERNFSSLKTRAQERMAAAREHFSVRTFRRGVIELSIVRK